MKPVTRIYRVIASGDSGGGPEEIWEYYATKAVAEKAAQGWEESGVPTEIHALEIPRDREKLCAWLRKHDKSVVENAVTV